MSFAWELPSPDCEDAEGYVWQQTGKTVDLVGYEQSILALYEDGYHVHTGVPLHEEGFIFPFDERVVLVGSEYVKARPR